MKSRVGQSLATVAVRSKGHSIQSHTRLLGNMKHVTHRPSQPSQPRPLAKWNEYSSHAWKTYKSFEMAGAQAPSAPIDMND